MDFSGHGTLVRVASGGHKTQKRSPNLCHGGGVTLWRADWTSMDERLVLGRVPNSMKTGFRWMILDSARAADPNPITTE